MPSKQFHQRDERKTDSLKIRVDVRVCRIAVGGPTPVSITLCHLAIHLTWHPVSDATINIWRLPAGDQQEAKPHQRLRSSWACFVVVVALSARKKMKWAWRKFDGRFRMPGPRWNAIACAFHVHR
ncbi:hypothetical protein Plav_1756 [Parvibaculum lavamentivorans DS-1]|uniref:Uncharacterized protein n=1 Tax=Parvibaculum lavamentivorans (strain DS-1 / DSM 13023 / NCIMB 13966) TaxID=402881 RepID=A7HTZ2_PARL1|nr:hypothetical protein Plav_1756 [Parvibaculum lavamentivorans DS-1]